MLLVYSVSFSHNYFINRSNAVPNTFFFYYQVLKFSGKCPLMNTLSVFNGSPYSSRRASVGGMRLILRAGI